MKEFAEFRIKENHAHLLFAKNEGKKLGPLYTVRKIIIDTTDPKYLEIGKFQKKISKGSGYFYSGWNLTRKYTSAEIKQAQIFQLIVTAYFEPTGEECGTIYDEAAACEICGSGAPQTNSLHLQLSSIPRGKDFAVTIADEFIVSKKAVDLFKKHKVTGAKFKPVIMGKKVKQASTDWFQLIIEPACLDICAPTRLGIEPFDEDEQGQYRCARDDLIGLNLLSEITVKRETNNKSDFESTRQFVGRRGGVLRPRRLIIVSQKIRNIIEDNKLRGCRLEVAYSL
jgi:hypothetical protein